MGGKVGTERIGSLSYGDHPQQRLFIHRVPHFETNEMRPVIAFIHGGSWRDGDPDYYDFIGRSLAAQGFLVVNLGYRLGDDGRWPAMLEDGAAGIAWVRANIADYGGDPDRIVLMGHSAGGHLTAEMMATRWNEEADDLPAAMIDAGLPFSGIFDFEPILHCSENDGMQMDAAVAAEISTILRSMPTDAPQLVAWGENETPDWQRQSQAYVERFATDARRIDALVVPGADHFDVVDVLADADSTLTARAQALILG